MTQEEMHSLFEYKNGGLYWKKRLSNRVKVGDRVGSLRRDGYRYVNVNNKTYLEHRIVYQMFSGEHPQEVDHINGVRTDNRFENLRSVTRNQNRQNSRLRRDNTSGVKNVSRETRTQKWQVQLGVDGRIMHFGYFEDLELAALVAYEAREKYHGKFANHGAIAA